MNLFEIRKKIKINNKKVKDRDKQLKWKKKDSCTVILVQNFSLIHAFFK